MDQDWIIKDAVWKSKIEADLAIIKPHFEEDGIIPKLTTMHSEFNLVKRMAQGLWAALIAIGGIWATWVSNKHQ